MRHVSKLFAALFLIFFGAHQGSAADAIVRSGEHSGFSRIVLHLPTRVGWTLTGEGRERQLVLDAPVTWDLREAFARISNDRLGRLAPLRQGQGLSFGLNCECELDVFWHGASMLVVDVQDRGYKRHAGTKFGASAVATDADASAFEMFLHSEVAGSARRVDHAALQHNAIELAAKNLEHAAQELDDGRVSDDDMARSARSAIAEEIARAASIGLVETKRNGDGARISNEAAQPLTPITGGSPAGPPIHRNLLAHNSTMRSESSLFPDRNSGAQEGCVPDALLAIKDWGTDAPFALQVGAARRAILEGDATQMTHASLTLARLYVFFGFGAEADHILRSSALTDEASRAVSALAQLLENGATDSAVFKDQLDCDGHVALWAALSSAGNVPGPRMNVDAILRSLASLPAHPKNLIGPRLAKVLLTAGQTDASDRVLRIVDRSNLAEEPSYGLERAKRSAATTPGSESEGTLLALVEKNDDVSPSALSELIDRRLDALDPVPESWVELAGSYAYEQGASDIGQALRSRYVSALAASGRFGQAFGELDRLRPVADAVTLARTSELIALYAVEHADDITFLKLLGYGNTPLLLGLSGSSANSVARRLLDLGFPAEALDFISEDAAAADQEERRLLRGEAALAQSKPVEAIASVMGLTGEDADTIRAQASKLLSRAGLAWPQLDDVNGAPDQMAQFQPNEKPAGRTGGDALISLNDQQDVAEPVQQTEALGALAGGAELLRHSETVRKTVADLLKAAKAPTALN